MTRALLGLSREVIEALLEMQIRPPVRNCSCHISPPCNDCVEYGGLREAMKDAQSTVDSITAALAQPEPEPASVLWVMTTPVGGRKFVIESESEAKRFAAMGNRSVVPFYAAPDTYRNPADDAALKRSFEAMESGISAELRKELSNMTARYTKLSDTHKKLGVAFGSVAAKAMAGDTDRLDAQRYQWLRQDIPASAVPRVWRSNESAEPTKCLHGSKLDDEIDQAMKGGQP
jgi:hypothetical protein